MPSFILSPLRNLENIKILLPGLMLCAFCGAGAWLLAELFYLFRIEMISVNLCVLFLGIILSPIGRQMTYRPGADFAIKTLLKIAIALLGFRISLMDIQEIGMGASLLVLASMLLTLLFGICMARLLGEHRDYGVLAGGATAICGASAALALATVLSPRHEKDSDTLFVILSCNALATLGMVLYPFVGQQLLHFDEMQLSIFLGATIHDVAQVAASAYGISPEVGDHAVVVKLFRVLCLLPMAMVVGTAFGATNLSRTTFKSLKPPTFALAFLLCVGINSLGFLPSWLPILLLHFSQSAMVLALAALGLQTSGSAFQHLTWRHFTLMISSAVFLMLFVGSALKMF